MNKFFPNADQLNLMKEKYRQKNFDTDIQVGDVVNLLSEKQIKSLFKKNFSQLYQYAVETYPESETINVKQLHQIILDNSELLLLNTFTNSTLYNELEDKYKEKLTDKIANYPDRSTKNKFVNKAMKSFNGCLLSRATPENLLECSQKSLEQDFSNFRLDRGDVQQNYYNAAINEGNTELGNILALNKPRYELSYMNKTLKEYALKNPQEFSSYSNLINAEGKYLNAIKNNIRNEQYKDLSRISNRSIMNSRPSIFIDESDL